MNVRHVFLFGFFPFAMAMSSRESSSYIYVCVCVCVCVRLVAMAHLLGLFGDGFVFRCVASVVWSSGEDMNGLCLHVCMIIRLVRVWRVASYFCLMR